MEGKPPEEKKKGLIGKLKDVAEECLWRLHNLINECKK